LHRVRRLGQPNWPWFLLALVPAVVSQIVRLRQTDPVAWIASEYAGRLGSLAVLVIITAARTTAFAREHVKISWLELGLWIICVTAFELVVARPISLMIDAAVPGMRLTTQPHLPNWLYAIDITFGVALVAYQEEVIFRRCARTVLRQSLGDGTAMVVAASLMFGCYHWSKGAGTITGAIMFGLVAMPFYRRAGALWPVVLVHYIIDALW
jgi:membrane protease YdiL (CAAX protease family)